MFLFSISITIVNIIQAITSIQYLRMYVCILYLQYFLILQFLALEHKKLDELISGMTKLVIYVLYYVSFQICTSMYGKTFEAENFCGWNRIKMSVDGSIAASCNNEFLWLVSYLSQNIHGWVKKRENRESFPP